MVFDIVSGGEQKRSFKIAVGSGGKRRQNGKLPVSSRGVRDPLDARSRMQESWYPPLLCCYLEHAQLTSLLVL